MEQRREDLHQFLKQDDNGSVDGITSLVALSASHAFEDDIAKARVELRKITPENKRNAEMWLQSCILYQEGMVALRMQPPSLISARLKFQEIERTNPSFVLCNLGLASIHLESKDYRLGFAKYRVVLEALGNFAPQVTRVGMAICCLHLKKIEHARKCLERAVELDAGDVLAHRVLIATALQQKDIECVTKSILALVQLTPDDPVILQRYVDSLYFKAMSEDKMSQPKVQKRQMDLIDKAQERAAGSNTLMAYGDYQKGRLAHALGNLNEAKPHYQAALGKYPTLRAASIALVKVQWKLGNHTEAFDMLRELAVVIPGDVEVSRMLSVVYSERSQHEEAARFAAAIVTTDAAGTPEAWHLSSYVNRLDKELSDKYIGNALKIQESEGTAPSWESKCNRAALNDNVNELADCVNGLFDTNAFFAELKKDKSTVAKKASSMQHVGTLLNYSRLLVKVNPSQAKALALFVLKHHGGLSEPLFLLHTIALEEKREKEAVTWLTLLFTIDKENPFSSAEISKLFLDGGASMAGQFAHAALSQGKQNSGGVLSANTVHVVTRGVMYLKEARRRGQRSKIADAMSHFRGALDEDRGNIVAAHGLACCTAMLGEPNVASTMFQRVIETRANNEELNQGDAQIHSITSDIMSGAYRSAVASAGKVSAQLNSRQRSELAFANLFLENYAEANKLLNEAIASAEETEDLESQEDPASQETSQGGLLGMLYYNKVVVLVTMSIQQLKKKDIGLTQQEGEEIKELLKESVRFARKAAKGTYKNDGKEAVLFMNDLLRELRNLERDRMKAVSRGGKLSAASQLLDQEWIATATEAKEARERDVVLAREREQADREQRQGRTDDTFHHLRSLIDEQWQAPEGAGEEGAQDHQELDFVGLDGIEEETDGALAAALDAGHSEEENVSRTKRNRDDTDADGNNETGAEVPATLNVN